MKDSGKLTQESINKHEILQKITPVLEKAVQDSGLVLVEANFIKEAGDWTLKLFIYNTQKPVTLEECETFTKKIGIFLEELIPVPFRLEVSSPGTERKLKTEKEYLIFKGERAKIKLKKSAEREQKTFQAIIKGYDPINGLTLKLPEGEEIRIKKEDISSVKLEPEYEFNKKKK